MTTLRKETNEESRKMQHDGADMQWWENQRKGWERAKEG